MPCDSTMISLPFLIGDDQEVINELLAKGMIQTADNSLAGIWLWQPETCRVILFV